MSGVRQWTGSWVACSVSISDSGIRIPRTFENKFIENAIPVAVADAHVDLLGMREGGGLQNGLCITERMNGYLLFRVQS